MQIVFTQSHDGPKQALAVFCGKDLNFSSAAQECDGATGGQVTRAARAARFDGETAAIVEVLAPVGLDADRLLIVGTGEAAKADAHSLERIGAALAARLQTSGEQVLTVDLHGLAALLPDTMSLAEAAARVGHGAELRSWRFDRYRTKLPEKQKPTLETIRFDHAPDAAEEAYRALKPVAEGVFLTRELVTEPANVMYPESFAERVGRLRDLGVEVEVLDEAAMRELGMGAFLGVSQGSARPPRLVVLRWNGLGSEPGQPVAFVGKGVTFDSGGISIKPASGMEDMKWDMGGAGAVAGLMHLLAARRAPAHVVGFCGLTENMPSGTAQRPGDVVTTMSGQTVEVINTDAEGRLVLCDVLWYAQDRFQPGTIVDLATLTGAIITALGKEYAGLFSNDDGLAAQLVAAGEASGEKLWRMPLGEAYDKLIDTPIADMKNVGPREGGSITAAQFLKRFIKPGVRWAHLDIAGTVWASKAGTLHDKGATGFGVRLLDRFVAMNHETH